MSDFFLDRCGIKPLEIDIDIRVESEALQSLRVYMEQKGQFFNYLRSEQEIVDERRAALSVEEKEEDDRKKKAREDQQTKEESERGRRKGEEKERLRGIAE